MKGSTRVAERWLPLPSVNAEQAALYGLTDVEADALAAVATGRTDEQAAEDLKIPIYTLKARLRRGFEKLKINDRAAASLYCAMSGIFDQYDGELPGRLKPPLEQLVKPGPNSAAATFNAALAFELREVRLGRDMTRQDLSDLTQIPAGTIRGYENGRAVPSNRLFAMCKALGVRSDALIQLAEARLLIRAMRANAMRGRGALTKVNLDTDEVEDYEDGEDGEQDR